MAAGRSVTFEVPGRAQPAGSKRAFPIKRKGGKIGVAVTDANPESRAWKERVALKAAEACRGMDIFEGPLRLKVVVCLLRPAGQLKKSGGLKKGARICPAVRPDITKLIRGIEDALNGLAWRDDSQIVEQEAMKLYADRNVTTITISEVVDCPFCGAEELVRRVP